MQPPYTRRLYSHLSAAAETVAAAAVPEGRLWVVRDIVVSNGGGASSYAVVTVLTRLGPNLTLLYASPLASAATIHVELRQVLETGDVLSVSFAAATLSCLITGYDLALVP